MDICIFYSWQSLYKDNCDRIIEKALEIAVNELNKESLDFHYIIKRGGGDVVGEEDIIDNIDIIIKTVADIALVDFTHIGPIPQRNPSSGEWEKVRCQPNANVSNEHGKLVMALDKRQVFKVYNTAYGAIDVNLEPPFDFRQKHYPVPFYCDDSKTADERIEIKKSLAKQIKARIKECTEVFLDNQKKRFAPLTPLRNEFSKQFWKNDFKQTKAYGAIYERVASGISFRLLGLPGLGKTRMVGESFRGKDTDVYYCDCKDQGNKIVENAVDELMEHRGSKRQVVILDNCPQKLCGNVTDAIRENGYDCQLITIHYDPNEDVDTGINGIPLRVEDFNEVVEGMVGDVKDMPQEVKDSIISMAGGFPLMAKIMIDNFHEGLPIANIRKKDVFERMLGIDPNNVTDQDKLKVLTAFSIFKYIGLYDHQEKQGRFIAGNRILSSNLRGTEDEKFQLFKEVHGQYEKVEILERQGNLVLMRLIPLAIYLCKSWFDKQTTQSIADLISQIKACPDEGTKNMLIESLSRRITLLNEVPLAKELKDGLTDPDNSPFLSEEVVLSALGSRLFLAFSEVNPEACAFALHRMIDRKSDEDIRSLEPARRNLAWALDHLAFDKRSFKNAMLTLARFAIVETEKHISNNTTGLFTDRFKIVLSGTEASLMARIDLINELVTESRYASLVKNSLCIGLGTGHFYRTGGAEVQGTRRLKDYMPYPREVKEYYNACLDILLKTVENQEDTDMIAKAIANNARGYYLQGMDSFLFRSLEELAPRKDYMWEEMKDALSYLLYYDVKKTGQRHKEEITSWIKKLTKDDYVYKLLHLGKEIQRHFDSSYEEEIKKIRERYGDMAKELIDKELYKDPVIMTGVMSGECFHYNSYGMTLASYSLEKGIQKEMLGVLLDYVLNKEVSKDGESMLIYFLLNVVDRSLLENTYAQVLQSGKVRLLPAMYAIKAEGEDKLNQLFYLLDNNELTIHDFSGYFYFRALKNYDVKYVAGRLLDYGAEGADLVLAHCHSLLFGDNELDEEYNSIARKCLLLVDLQGIQRNDFVYLQSMNNYLEKHHDDEMALRIQALQEKGFKESYSHDNYYLGQLYRKVLKGYTDLLKPRLFELLEDEDERHDWIDLMRTSYPKETGEEGPIYELIPLEEWFGWLESTSTNDRAYALAMFLSYSVDNGANPEYLRLVDNHWSDVVKSALSSRFHSFSWSGSGIPLYQSRIAICEDYIKKLKNDVAREWFKHDISIWETEIEQELLQNAHERAMYD